MLMPTLTPLQRPEFSYLKLLYEMRNLKYYDYNTIFFFYNANMLLTNMYLVYTKCHMP